ncbi:MAG TPA: helix-turn-helix domain-containing protein [Candidatus Deferrimicrobiaceae bacterium]|nr:helix-turn-helix domain-containing protein [Candidatus Deferrimicrobiaceae bacterium]
MSEPTGPTAARAPSSDVREPAASPNGSPANGAANGRGPNGLATPSALRRALLLFLRQSGPTSPDGLAAALGASRTGVLQQLHALEEAGLVNHAREKHGVGRPRHLYDVTPDAQELFPADYAGFAASILAAVESLGGGDLIEEVFEARRRQAGDRIRAQLAAEGGASSSLDDRVRALAVIQDEGGYLAEAVVGEDGVIRLHEHNCAIYHIARGNHAACEAELELFREVLGADVVRETHIAAGDRCCSYRIAPPAN